MNKVRNAGVFQSSTPGKQPEARPNSRFPRFAPLALVLVLGIAFSVAGSLIVQRGKYADVDHEFERHVNAYANILQTVLTVSENNLTSVADLFAASPKVDFQAFRTFTRPILGRQPGIWAFSWFPRVPAAQKEEFERAAGAKMFPDYRIKELDASGGLVPAAPRDEYFPILFYEPIEPAERAAAWGFEPMAEPIRRRAFESARDTGQTIATGRIRLVTVSRDQFAVAVVRAIYRNGAAVDTIEQRRDALSGYITAIIRISNLVETSLDKLNPGGLDIYLFDDDATGSEARFLYFHGSRTRSDGANLGPEAKPRAGMYSSQALNVGGRTWTAIFKPAPGYFETNYRRAMAVFLGGLLLTSLLVFHQRSILLQNMRVSRLVTNRTAALRDSEASLENAQRIARVGSWKLTVETGEIEWTAESFRIFGQDPKTFKPNYGAWCALVHPDDLARIEKTRALTNDENVFETLEYRIVWPDGSVHILSSERESVRDAAGDVIALNGTVRDVTSDRLAEEALRKSQASLANAQRIGRFGSWDWDIVTNEVYRSDEIYRIYGITREDFELSYEGYLDIVHPDDRDDVKAAFDATLHGNAVHSFDYRIVRPDGEVRVIHEEGEALFNGAGEPIAISGTVQDVSEVRRAEEARRQSEDQLRLVTDNIPVLIGYIDAEGYGRFANKTLLAWYHRTREEIIGKHIKEVFAKERYDEFTAHIQRVFKGEPQFFNQTVTYPDGITRQVEVSQIPHVAADGKILGVIILTIDISERRSAEEAIRKSEEKYQTIIDTTTQGYWRIGTDMKIVDVNNAICQMLGYSREELLGKRPIDFFGPGEAAAIEARINEGLRSGGTEQGIEHMLRRKDGTFLSAVSTATTILDENGKTTGRFALIHDNTEQKAREAQLRQSQKMEAVGQLTGGVAHDFNNLLAVILGNLEMAINKLGTRDEVTGFMEKAIRSTERGAELTQRLLAFSRQQILEPTVVDLNRTVDGMIDLLRRTLGERVEITTSLTEELWACKADRSQIESALLNLALNARDAMPDGGKLTIESANVPLDDNYTAIQADVIPGDYVMLAVSDTGIGIAVEDLEHIFEPFYTTKEVGQGSGLGLSMVFGFVKQSGGHITVYSEVGDGTTFKIYLPKCSEPVKPAKPGGKAESEKQAHGETILVVEDDPDLRTLAVTIVSSLGYQVMEAGSGAAALELLKHGGHVDLVLTDVILPGGMNGPELARTIRRDRPETRAIFMSGYTEKAMARGVELDEGEPFLQKPFRKQDLADKLRQVLDRS